MDGLISIGNRRVPEVRLWAVAGALAVLTGLPETAALPWLTLGSAFGDPSGMLFFALLGPASLLAFAAATWAVRGTTNPVVMRAWAAFAWAVFVGPALALTLPMVSAVVPHAAPEVVGPIVGVAAVVLWLGGSAALAAATYSIGRRWFATRTVVHSGPSTQTT